ncbi:MAG: DUF3109 family protein [Sphingobacteriaceae bacterium]|nr:DUF3109 family protein [Sphingobacteriaceae bacterium]
MIAIDKTLISEDVIEKNFVCDLNACKGACCVAGDSGAPLDKEELPILESIVEKVKPFMVKKGVKAVEKFGAWEKDSDGDYTTTLVSEGAECAFVYFDENKIAKCAIEKAHAEGLIDWQKPISCHLYPIRITKHKTFDAVNYNKWDVCKPACACGEKLKVPVYKFLKTPLIRKYGKNWYKQLEESAKLFVKKK